MQPTTYNRNLIIGSFSSKGRLVSCNGCNCLYLENVKIIPISFLKFNGQIIIVGKLLKKYGARAYHFLEQSEKQLRMNV